MGQIYQNAELTSIWLCSNNGTVEEAFEILQQLVTEMAREMNNFDRTTMDSKHVGLFRSGAARPRT
jgi:hypothetical protein